MNLTMLQTTVNPITSEQRQYETNQSHIHHHKNHPIHTGSRKIAPSTHNGTPGDVKMFPSQTTTSPTIAKATRSIPISKSIKRTPSEIQLVEDEAAADYRDYCMYTRIVNGIYEQGPYRSKPTNESLANIIRTRHLPLREPSSYQDDYYLQPTWPTRHEAIAEPLHYSWPTHNGQQIWVQEQQQQLQNHVPEDDGIFVMDL